MSMHCPLSVQDQLVDFLRTGRYTPLGEKASQYSDARVICTTTRDLSMLADQGVFNRDLAELLKETVSIPPLRKRKRDIREVVGQLLLGCARQLGRPAQTLDEDAYKAIMAYDWPGNIDELSVVIRRAVMLSQGETLLPEHIFIGPPPVTGRAAFDLFSLERIKGLFLSTKYPSFIQAAVAPFIGLIILLGPGRSTGSKQQRCPRAHLGILGTISGNRQFLFCEGMVQRLPAWAFRIFCRQVCRS